MACVREIPASIVGDRETFLGEVVSTCQPAVIRALCDDWPLLKSGPAPQAMAAYLCAFDSGRPAEAYWGDPAIAGRYFYGEANGFNFDRRPMSLSQVLEAIVTATNDDQSIYMGSLPADSYLPGFTEANRLSILSDKFVPRLWIGSRSTIACHYDTQDNLACVAAGRRRFTLYPPDAIGDLYVGPIDHTLAGQPVSLAANAQTDDPRFPRFERARSRAITVELAAGDALYLPKLWWHQVEATASFNILVNYWWDAFTPGPDQPHTAMMLAMITIADRPAAERAAWRAFFDHYVFRPDGHPLAHLPADRHGILGPVRPHNYGRIRARVMQLLRGD